MKIIKYIQLDSKMFVDIRNNRTYIYKEIKLTNKGVLYYKKSGISVTENLSLIYIDKPESHAIKKNKKYFGLMVTIIFYCPEINQFIFI